MSSLTRTAEWRRLPVVLGLLVALALIAASTHTHQELAADNGSASVSTSCTVCAHTKAPAMPAVPVATGNVARGIAENLCEPATAPRELLRAGSPGSRAPPRLS